MTVIISFGACCFRNFNYRASLLGGESNVDCEVHFTRETELGE